MVLADASRGGREAACLQGAAVSPGIVAGPVFVLRRHLAGLVERPIDISAVEAELGRLHAALDTTREQIEGLQERLQRDSPMADSTILDAHLMILEDPAFLGKIKSEAHKRLCNIEVVVRDVAQGYIKVLTGLHDGYFKERAGDIRDVIRRLVRNLLGDREDHVPTDLGGEVIVVAEDLEPSETVALPKGQVLGFATDHGSTTSHAALLARSLEIPAVVALHDISRRVQTGDKVLMDAYAGWVIINPTTEQIKEALAVEAARRGVIRGLDDLKDEPATTLDGRQVRLYANMEAEEEAESVMQHGAEGVGLFRTEYLWLSEERDISEQEQRKVYRAIAHQMAPMPVIIRTLDLGGDKSYSGAPLKQEKNPFLGMRSTRFLLKYPGMFKRQLRAILAASTETNIMLMYPMITDVSELIACNRLLEECKEELAREEVPFNGSIEVGAMVEVPSAALTADILAPHVKFFCLGTNDLVQYALAVDRVNDDVGYLYQPTHPSVIKLIQNTIDAGKRHDVWVGICGEMAADPLLTPLLLGMGIEEFSVAPAAVPIVKAVIRSLRMTDARALVRAAMECSTSAGVQELCREILARVAPKILTLVVD